MITHEQPMELATILARLRSMLGRANKRDKAALQAAMAALFELATLLHVERSRTAGVTIVDEAGPVTPEMVEELLRSRRRRRAEQLPPRSRLDDLTAADEIETLPPPAVRGLHTTSLLVEHPETGELIETVTTCGARCETHDECEYPCRRLQLHEGACDCRHGMTADEVCERLARAGEGPPGPGSLDA